MGKEEDLRKQLEDLKASKEILIERVENCIKGSNSFSSSASAQYVKLYHTITPYLKAQIEKKIKTGEWNASGISHDVLELAMKAIFGDDVYEHLDRI